MRIFQEEIFTSFGGYHFQNTEEALEIAIMIQCMDLEPVFGQEMHMNYTEFRER